MSLSTVLATGAPVANRFLGTMTFLEIFALSGLVILALMTLLWGLSLLVRDASIVDPFWGAGFVLAGWLYLALTPEGFLTRRLLITALATIWGLRLSLYLLWRNLPQGEDYRYRRWREEGGARWWWVSLFRVFWLQGVLMWLISAPLLAAQIAPTPARLTVLDGAAVLLWGVGFFFEAVADWQLARFRSDPDNAGRLLTAGLWRYSRHPNYFGDGLQWWAFYLAAVAGGGWFTLFSPLLMTGLLRFVSGVPLLERNLKRSRPGYAAYAAATNAFIPWFPRRR